MQVGRIARIVFGLNALVVAVGIIVQLFVTADLDSGFFDTPLKRTLNVFCYFTIQSNILVCVGTGLLALGRASETTWFRVVRLTGLVGIALTFVVFHAVLRDLQDLTGNAALADFLLHTVSPVLCVGGWLWFGPRGQTSRTVVFWSLGFLIVWGAFTMIRGAMLDFYPYPFMDPIDSGYLRVVVNLVIVGAVFIAMAAGAHWLDKKLPEHDD